MLIVDEPLATLMSVNNGTYFVVFVQADFNASFDRASVSLLVSPTNDSDTVHSWTWTGNHFVGNGDVRANGGLSNGVMRVTFGSPIASVVGPHLRMGIPYDDLMKLAISRNSSSPASVNFADSMSFGFELVPYIDHYPKIPLLYSAVIIVAGLFFLFLEDRKHRRPRT